MCFLFLGEKQLIGQYLLFRNKKDMKTLDHCQLMFDYLKAGATTVSLPFLLSYAPLGFIAVNSSISCHMPCMDVCMHV